MRFAGHQKFHIREGWLLKALRLLQDPARAGVFKNRDDAAKRLSLGVNMVRSLRYWLLATKVAAETTKGMLDLTTLGQLIVQHDPYLESESTLWLLHGNLATNIEDATTWFWFFNYFRRPTFTRAEPLPELAQWAILNDQSVSEDSLRSDLSCLLNTYVGSGSSDEDDESLDCPLASLGLIRRNGKDAYRIAGPRLARFNPLLVLWAMVHWQQIHLPLSDQIEFSQVLREPGNAGAVFGLDRPGLADMLARLGDRFPLYSVRFVRNAGLESIVIPRVSLDEIVSQLLHQEGRATVI